MLPYKTPLVCFRKKTACIVTSGEFGKKFYGMFEISIRQIAFGALLPNAPILSM